MEHTRVLYGRNTLSSPKLWLFDDSNASLNETDAAIAQKTTSSDQNDVILQFYQIHGVISTPSMMELELESNSNKYDTLAPTSSKAKSIFYGKIVQLIFGFYNCELIFDRNIRQRIPCRILIILLH